MKCLCRVIVCSLFPVTFLILGTSAATFSDVASVNPYDPAQPFVLEEARVEINPDGCDYSPELKFTITSIDQQTMQYLFAQTTIATVVVKKWTENTKGRTEFPDKLHAALLNLNAELQLSRYKSLNFGTMVEMRLRKPTGFPLPMKALDDRINELIQAGFQFPLLDKNNGSEADGKLYLLKKFIEAYGGPNEGGLGNVRWSTLFELPADPALFSDDFIRDNVIDMQGEVIPNPQLQCPDESGKMKFFSSENLCCCNDINHGVYYHTCQSIDNAAYKCRSSSGVCVLFGVIWCPLVHDPHGP